MVDNSRSKAQLHEEIQQLRQRVAELETMANAVPFEQTISKTIIDTSPAFFVIIDSKGKTQMMNKSMLAALGYSEDEIIGKDYLSTFVPERDQDQLSALIEKQLLQGEPTFNQNHIVTKDGQELLVEWQGRPLLDSNGDIEFFCGVGLDVTERKLTEDVLQRVSEDEIKRREELEKLREISTSLRQAEGSSNLLEVFTKEVQEFCNADVVASLQFKDPDSPVFCYKPDSNMQLNQMQYDAITAALLKTNKGSLTAVVQGFESVLVLALQSSETMYGAVLVASRKSEAFTPEERNVLNAIADMAGTALHRIDILETLEERVQRRTHDLVVLYNLITIISENWRLQDILELSLMLTLETVKADRGIIYLLDGKEPPGLNPIIQRGFSNGFAVDPDSIPDDEGAQEVLRLHKPLALEDLSEIPGYARFNEISSYAGIPILVRGEMRGVFSLFASEKDVFGSDEMALLASIADHLGIGIDNSILWEQSRENAALEERNRLARNLHDSVSQQLYSLTLMAGSTKKMLERDHDLDAVKHSVLRLGDTAHQALKEMRLLLYELRPAVLDSEGLISALQHRIETVEGRLGVKVGLQTNGLPDLPNDTEDALYHIALEALNNIVKHSESTTATITFANNGEYLVMEISDNGKGFDMNRRQEGLGLSNMRERGQMLGGEVEVHSTPGKGTRVRVEIKSPFLSIVEA